MNNSTSKTPVSVSIKECRTCARQFYVGEKILKLHPDDEIEIILQLFKCQECRNRHNNPRQPL